MVNIFFIDPMSYENLAIYDYNLLSSASNARVWFFQNTKYHYKEFDNPNVVPCPVFSYTGKKLPAKAVSYCVSIFRIALKILTEKPEIVHIQWVKAWTVDYYLIRIIKLLNPSTRVVFTAHNVVPHKHTGRDLSRFKRYYRLVDTIICHTRSTKSELITLFGIDAGKIHVIPLGPFNYHLDDGAVEAAQREMERKYSLHDKLIFSVLGSQSHYKGIDLLIQAWVSERKFYGNEKIALLLIGKNEGCDYSPLENVRNVVIEDRFVRDEEFIAILRMTDVLLLPYREISQSGVLFTAINERVPFMVTNIGGISDPLDHARVGWNIGEPTIQNITSFLKEIIDNRDAIDAIKADASAWNKLKEVYSWTTIARETFRLYTQTEHRVLSSPAFQ